MKNTNETLNDIRKLVGIGKYDEALEMCTNCSFSSADIDYYKALILLKLGKKSNDKIKLRQALAICNSYSEYDNGFSSIKREANILIQGIELRKSRNNFPYNIAVNKIFTRVYYNDITSDEIKEADIPQFRKEIILLAYYEKNNRTVGLKYIKELKKKYNGDKTKTRLINPLYERFACKNKMLYDLGIYGSIINCSIDSNYKPISNNTCDVTYSNINDKNINVDLEKNGNVPKKVNNLNVSNYVSCQGKKVNSRYESVRTSNYKVRSKDTIKQENKILIKDIFSMEILEVQKELYLMMQSSDIKIRQNAIKAFDNFELLIEKSVNDTIALNKTLKLLKILNLVTDEDDNIKKYVK